MKKKSGDSREMQLIYCGPTVANVVTSGSVFIGRPPHIETLCSRYPLLRSLIVPVQSYPEIKKQLAQPGSAMATVYAEALKQLKEGK